MKGVMTKRCPNCQGGVIVLFTNEGRKEVSCGCARGREREAEIAEAKLRADLLAAFYEAGKTS